MTYDDRDRDMRDDPTPPEGDVRDDLDLRRSTDVVDERVTDDDRAGDEIEDEAEEGETKPDYQSTTL